MVQKNKKIPNDARALFKRLNAEGKVKLFMKYVDRPDLFYQIVAILGTDIATNAELLNSIGEEYKKIREELQEQTAECWRKQLDFFQTLIDFHQRSFRQKGAAK